jgi:putative nucleotidyltransferase with HDIG domain
MHHGAAFATHAREEPTAQDPGGSGPFARLRQLFSGRGGYPSDLDPTTGLLTRSAFERALDVELERARRQRGSAALLLIELELPDDRTERESALRGSGRTLSAGKRCYDSAARVGEARLAVLAPDSDEHGAYILAERLRRELGVTSAVGVAAFPLHGGSPAALTRAAEHALQAAAGLGGNRVVISSAEVHGVLSGPPAEGSGPQVELAMLVRLAEALDVKESGSASHSRRVGRLAELAARELGLAPERVERVRVAGLLHDVGRVGVPEELVRKRGPLSQDDWTLVRAHPEVGARLVETTDFDEVPGWILTHHERPDGSGYPEGVRWDQVPLEGRILAVADAWEAMTSERSYRPALATDDAARELRRGAGSQFDENVVEALLKAV